MQLAFPRCKSRACVAILVLLAMVDAQAAGLRSEEELLYRGTLSYGTATKEWDDDAVTRDIGCRANNTRFSNYLEYGYSYYHTAYGSISAGYSECGSESRAGLSDLNFGLRGRINQYLNTRSWQLGVTLPLRGREEGRSRIGCGVFGVDAEVSRRDELSPSLSLGYGTTLKLWESPLAHQIGLNVSLGGPFASRSPWSWYAALAGEAPVNDGKADPGASVSDCGTEAKVLRGAVQLRRAFDQGYSASCGLSGTFVGEDISQSRGLYCAFSRLWK